jgi:hypothetical protein
MHAPADENAPDGQEETHLPADASCEPAHVRQNVAEPLQEPQDESHGLQVMLSSGERKVPLGQSAMHVPLESTELGRHAVHCSWFTVAATLKFGIPHAVHFAGQPAP